MRNIITFIATLAFTACSPVFAEDSGEVTITISGGACSVNIDSGDGDGDGNADVPTAPDNGNDNDSEDGNGANDDNDTPEEPSSPDRKVFDVINWASPGSQIDIPLGRDEILSSQFTTTENPSYAGQVSVTSTTGNSGVSKRVWISKEPEGEALNSNCEDTGTTSTVIRWQQGAYNTRSYCILGTNTTYYINYQNVDCDEEKCAISRIIYNNDRA